MLRSPSGANEKAKREKEDKVVQREVHAEGWHIEIDKNQLRWESYVKAGYYVSVSFK